MDSQGNEASFRWLQFFLVPNAFTCIISHIKIHKYIDSICINVTDMDCFGGNQNTAFFACFT